MAPLELPSDEMKGQLTNFSSALSSFASSPSTFRVLTTIPPQAPPPSTFYVLDSSFNPPTVAHLQIATSALQQDLSPPPKRLLLLLATQNADKAPKPASFEHRLQLMTLFATDLLKTLQRPRAPIPVAETGIEEEESRDEDLPTIDIVLTKHPYFIHKANAITSSNLYPPQTTQIHLIGYDTLIRILDPRYYPPDHTLAVLEPFFAAHRLRVTYRAGADWGEREAQEAYLARLGREGASREWVENGRIVLVEGRREEEEGRGVEMVSSTRVREAVREGDERLLGKMVTEGVKGFILEQKLYLED